VQEGENKIEGFSGSRWTPQTDVGGFASILFEVIVGRPMNGETSIPWTVPEFVSKIIEEGVWSESNIRCSFCNIDQILKDNNFNIVEGVNSSEVLAFVKLIESAENPG
jgi:hypothetical protein